MPRKSGTAVQVQQRADGVARQPRPRDEHHPQPRERDRLLDVEGQRRRAEEQHRDERQQRREEEQPVPRQRGRLQVARHATTT
jgi:hypothetical protein